MNFVKPFQLLLFILFSSSLHSQEEGMKSYYFGHSLVAHTMGDQSIPHWMYLLSQTADKSYAVDGQYGFLPIHEIPPIAAWGFEIVPSTWQGDFADSDYDNVVITAANFIQYQAPTEEFLETNTVDASLVIFDYVRSQSPDIPFYIYENWPEFNAFPPTDLQFQQYHDITRTSFHDWWIDLQDLCNAEREDANIKLIPVGYILAGLLTDFPDLAAIAATDLYEDGDPHGEAVIYFLSALVHYSALYQEQAPLNFEIPAEFPTAIAENYSDIIDYIWQELLDFNDDQGNSRVFFDVLNDIPTIESNTFQVFPNPFSNQLNIQSQDWETDALVRILNSLGQQMYLGKASSINTELWKSGTYFYQFMSEKDILSTGILIKP